MVSTKGISEFFTMADKTLLYLPLLAMTASIMCQEYKTVNTCSGPVKGIVEYRDNTKVYTFRGIPYAKPPIGDLRFRKPEPIDSWVNELDATRFGPPCVQMGAVNVSEDCLHLNIYVPHNISTSNKMAVMVWIHGGGYSLGEGAFYDGSNLAVKGEVIVVTFNYRLGIFGFLNTNDKESPGNFGLWDQITVFQWVKSNIKRFGGNPSAVTLFGQSAGAMSVSFHTIIPYNKGLFQRAIAQSGTVFSSPVLKHSDNEKFIKFLNGNLNCTSSTQFNTSEFVQCLKQKSAETLSNIANGYLFDVKETQEAISIAPSIDGDLIIADPDVLLSDKNSYAYIFFRSLDYMAGTTNGESSHFLGVLSYLISRNVINISLAEGISTQFLCDTFSRDTAKVYFESSPKATKALCDKYSYHGNKNKLIEQGILVADMQTDTFMIAPTVKTLKIHDEKNMEGTTYQYFFTRTVPFGLVVPWFNKASHGSELPFLFSPSTLGLANITDDESLLADKIVEYWSNFAKTGNPNSASLPTWGEYGEDKNYIQLDLNITAHKDLFPDKMKLILEDIPRLISQPPRPPPPVGSACQHSLFLTFVFSLINCVLLYINNVM